MSRDAIRHIVKMLARRMAGANDDVVPMAATAPSVDTATEAVAETADAEPAEAAVRMPPLTSLAGTAASGLLRMSRDAIRHIVKKLAYRMAAQMPETAPATPPAEVTSATDKHRALASEILARARTKGSASSSTSRSGS